ncbi:MAG TPA: MgtC/SapB family protein [Bacilli bacterium]|nr:MgtC/SapB family protein [Bacilli bacterium]
MNFLVDFTESSNYYQTPSTFDKLIIDWFTSMGEVGMFLLAVSCLLAAAIFAGIIGFEREYHGHSAGLRTHMLVAVGSASIMIISIWGFPTWQAVRDPARLAAQVVTGIGFLGAGTIIQTGTDIKGLTTATTLWIVMAIGLAAGAGQFSIALIATVFTLIILVSLRKIEHLANKRAPKVTVVVSTNSSILRDLHIIASRFGINIRDIQSQMITIGSESFLRVTFNISYASRSTTTAFTEEIKDQIKPLELRVSSEF